MNKHSLTFRRRAHVPQMPQLQAPYSTFERHPRLVGGRLVGDGVNRYHKSVLCTTKLEPEMLLVLIVVCFCVVHVKSWADAASAGAYLTSHKS